MRFAGVFHRTLTIPGRQRGSMGQIR
jgi:hypothetical protein